MPARCAINKSKRTSRSTISAHVLAAQRRLREDFMQHQWIRLARRLIGATVL
jgi:hypothetical protein